MNHLQLPSMRTVVENIPLETAKLDKILAESQSRVASYLDIRYPDSQDIIFLLGGKAVKAGRFYADSREILTVTEALDKLRSQKSGTISFFEITKLIMIVIMGTFIFEPTHGGLKTKQVNFNSLLSLFLRKRFTGYLELKMSDSLNYLTFLSGQPREGYFGQQVSEEDIEFPVKRITAMVESSDEKGEINVYESVGEGELHESEDREHKTEPALEPVPGDEEGKNQFTSEILDLCLVAIYEELFRIMFAASSRHLDAKHVENVFGESLTSATQLHPELFKGANLKDEGTPLPGGAVNFESLLKSKGTLPFAQRDPEFLKGMNDLALFRLKAMQKGLAKADFEIGVRELTDKIAAYKKNYQGNFTINKVLYDISRILEKIRTENAGG